MAYENVIIAVVIIGVLIFGAKKIPELAKTFGKAKGEFEKGRLESEKELKDFKDKEDLK
ncbi:Sec-independent protein translocase subunit TatA/TatB [Candidatus Nitrosotalea okcheonensis]|uniref:Translocase n=1 Tax=Candidatus Nitrosotalea okcheonensis TaxID=1903276 RepID=A0A2H1FCU6_9ARCH|nr:twin-arginine translocase TatA/TatE family subunit [Candidatus Nitrosotalea okcheonensis]MDE1728120.1 twin-arginine translocase TatA/TatE family subunit [Nitrososphaerota archaeon]MDH2907379.1 twin-arginine translocase TatA/TatE family subunit [Candidatus Nitrosotalea sp.]MDE1813508.1 twin-arginine translocase TatA/TatE family subunit [Nitrososphaerota archaeon]MDE1830879.1 twin-arginine translocase TatA/TatE family subunit [Nitrososphaerota archaeon]MDE1839332.1 twin-arginine translocase T